MKVKVFSIADGEHEIEMLPPKVATETSVAVCPHGDVPVYCSRCTEIDRAVMAERERCAKIADDAFESSFNSGISATQLASDITAKIRSGK